jgi:hypothetical protein
MPPLCACAGREVMAEQPEHGQARLKICIKQYSAQPGVEEDA